MAAMTASTEPPPAKTAFLGLTYRQLISGALAAMTTTLVASRLGVVGTLIGAAFGSVASASAAALYTRSLEHAGRTVVQTRERLATTRLPIPPRQSVTSSEESVDETVVQPVDETVVQPAEETVIQSVDETVVQPVDQPDQDLSAPSPRPSARGWRVWALAGVGLFLLVMATVFVLELLIGQPFSGSGETSGGGTTLGRVFQGDVGGGSDPDSTPTESASTDTGTSSDVTPTDQTNLDTSVSVDASSTFTDSTDTGSTDTGSSDTAPADPAPTAAPVG